MQFGSKTMISHVSVEILNNLFRLYKVPGDGSCFYSSVACCLCSENHEYIPVHRIHLMTHPRNEIQFVNVPKIEKVLRKGQKLRRVLAVHIQSDEFAFQRLQNLGEDPDEFLDGILGNEMADEPAIAETVALLKRPILVFEVQANGREVKGYRIGAEHDGEPIVLWRSGEHYDALLPHFK
jgi:hypothetical protein